MPVVSGGDLDDEEARSDEEVEDFREGRAGSVRSCNACLRLRDEKMETGIRRNASEVRTSRADGKSEGRRAVRESSGNYQRPVGATRRDDRTRRRGSEAHNRVQNSASRAGRSQLSLNLVLKSPKICRVKWCMEPRVLDTPYCAAHTERWLRAHPRMRIRNP